MRHNKYLLFVILIAISSLFSACTVGRIVWFFKPSVTDHQHVFACDTVQPTAPVLTSTLQSNFAAESTNFATHAPQELPSIDDWAPLEHRMGAKNVDELLKVTKTNALIIIKNDSLVYERYLDGRKREDPNIVFSVTKAITATLVAIAAEEGHISLEDPVATYIPAFANDERKAIQIKHLMGMVSGLGWNDFRQLLRLGGLYYTLNELRFVSRVKAIHPPETHFAYKSASTQILGLCLEKAIGQSLASYMEAKLWRPIGTEFPAYVTLDSRKHHNSRAFGGLAVTPVDMARLGTLLLKDGKWQDQQLIPRWFVEELKNRSADRWFGYSNCYWRNGYEQADALQNQHYWAAGYQGQYIYVAPEQNMVLIRTGTEEAVSWSTLLGRLAYRMGEGRTDMTDASLDFGEQFAGTYERADGEQMKLELLGEKDKYQRRQWNWSRDLTKFKEGKKHDVLYQLDGQSLGYKRKDHQIRMYYKIEKGQVQGFHYNAWPSTVLEYYKKVK